MLVKERFLRSSTESKLGREGREVRMGQSTRRNRRTAGLACFLSEGADGLGQGPWEAGRVGNSMGKSPGR